MISQKKRNLKKKWKKFFQNSKISKRNQCQFQTMLGCCQNPVNLRVRYSSEINKIKKNDTLKKKRKKTFFKNSINVSVSQCQDLLNVRVR